MTCVDWFYGPVWWIHDKPENRNEPESKCSILKMRRLKPACEISVISGLSNMENPTCITGQLRKNIKNKSYFLLEQNMLGDAVTRRRNVMTIARSSLRLGARWKSNAWRHHVNIQSSRQPASVPVTKWSRNRPHNRRKIYVWAPKINSVGIWK